MKYDLLSVIPFFGGDSSAAHSLKETRLEYFIKTYDSLINISDMIVVSVCLPEDMELIYSLNLNIDLWNLQGADPIFLPYHTVINLQSKFEYKYLYYTEGDQILYIKDRDMVFNILDENKYLVPQRFERIYQGIGTDRGENVRFKDGSFAVCNKSNINRYDFEPDKRFYVNTHTVDAFGGAFLCHKDLFNRVHFNTSEHLPIEHTSGFDLFNTLGAICLKTANVFDFFVEHLSGYEYHKQLAVQNAVGTAV